MTDFERKKNAAIDALQLAGAKRLSALELVKEAEHAERRAAAVVGVLQDADIARRRDEGIAAKRELEKLNEVIRALTIEQIRAFVTAALERVKTSGEYAADSVIERAPAWIATEIKS